VDRRIGKDRAGDASVDLDGPGDRDASSERGVASPVEIVARSERTSVCNDDPTNLLGEQSAMRWSSACIAKVVAIDASRLVETASVVHPLDRGVGDLEAKHGVRFEEAAQAFTDPFSIDFADALFPDRLVTVAMSPAERILYVVTTERGSRTRIISARRASPHERRIYEASP
jgi:uncharacterized DUF497 family protein